MDAIQTPRRSWRETIFACFQGRVLAMLFLGFSAGLPLLLIFSSLSLWLREAGVERSTVTFFSWAALGYSFKFVWAPLVDCLPLPVLTRWLGRRRSWLLVSQLAIIAAMLWMACHNPQDSLVMVAVGAVMLGFSSATQDIVIDAYRIEAADADFQALMSSTYIAGYRIGMLTAGAGALALASWFGSGDGAAYDYTAWSYAYLCMAVLMLVGIITTFSIKEPKAQSPSQSLTYQTADYFRFVGLFCAAIAVFLFSFINLGNKVGVVSQFLQPVTGQLAAAFLAEAVRMITSIGAALLVAWSLVQRRLVSPRMVEETYVAPFRDFFNRFGKLALFILLLIATFRIADLLMGAVANVFYDDIGYTKQQIAVTSKTFGLLMTITGGFLGGILAIRYGVINSMLLGALLAAMSNFLFAFLAIVALEPGMLADVIAIDSVPQTWMLAGVIAIDNLSGGLASSAFVAYLSSLTNRAFTAMQFAVFSSLMTLLPKLLAGYSGTWVNNIGYPSFFIASALIGLPVLWLVYYVGKRMPPEVGRA